MRKHFISSIAAALTMAAMATSVPMMPANAAASPQSLAATAAKSQPVVSDELSARRRHHRHYRHYRHYGGGAAALGAFGAIAGTIGAIAADEQRRDYCYRYGCYGYGAPYGYYYGPRYYRW